jgi:hypothetical protein
MMHFLAGEKWAIAIPLLAVFGGEGKGAFASADPDSYRRFTRHEIPPARKAMCPQMGR